MEKEDEAIVGKIYGVINKIAEEKGFKESGYRVIVNCGKDAGQEVMHLHFHILAGAKFGDIIVYLILQQLLVHQKTKVNIKIYENL